MRRSLAIASILLAGGVSPEKPPQAPPPATEEHPGSPGSMEAASQKPASLNQPINDLSKEALQAYVAFFPARASQLGVPGFEGKLGDYGKSAIARFVSSNKGCLARLEKLNAAGFTDGGRVERESLRVHLRSMIRLLETADVPSHDPNFYVDESVGAIQTMLDRDTVSPTARVGNLLSRMRSFPEFLLTARENLGACPRPLVLRAITRLRASNPLFDRKVRGELRRPGFLGARLETLNTTTDSTWKEVSSFADWLEKERLPQASDPAPLGEKGWREWLLSREETDLSPPAVIAAATADMSSLRDELREAAAKIDKQKDAAAVLAAVSADRLEPRLARDAAERVMSELWRFVLHEKLVDLPDENEAVSVIETPAFRRREAPVRANMPGSFFPPGAGTFLEIAAPDPDWPMPSLLTWLESYGKSFIPLAVAREVYPGRFTAWQYLGRSEVPTGRTALFPTMVEGWALYAEELTVRSGFRGDDAKLKLAMLADLIRADARLVAAVRLHAMGAPAKEVRDSLTREAFWPPSVAAAEVDRILADPDRACPALGRLAILALRAQQMKAKGSAFSPREFHRGLLSYGAAPISSIRRVMLGDGKGSFLSPVK